MIGGYHLGMDNRINRLTAVQVDLAINIASAFNMEAGVQALEEQGISPSVVKRVLIECGPRRGLRTLSTQPLLDGPAYSRRQSEAASHLSNPDTQ